MSKFVRTVDGGFVNIDLARRIIPADESGLYRVQVVHGVEVICTSEALREAGFSGAGQRSQVTEEGAP